MGGKYSTILTFPFFSVVELNCILMHFFCCCSTCFSLILWTRPRRTKSKCMGGGEGEWRREKMIRRTEKKHKRKKRRKLSPWKLNYVRVTRNQGSKEFSSQIVITFMLMWIVFFLLLVRLARRSFNLLSSSAYFFISPFALKWKFPHHVDLTALFRVSTNRRRRWVVKLGGGGC